MTFNSSLIKMERPVISMIPKIPEFSKEVRDLGLLQSLFVGDMGFLDPESDRIV